MVKMNLKNLSSKLLKIKSMPLSGCGTKRTQQTKGNLA
ncbi:MULTISPECIES: TQQ cross-linked RaS-RiPP peptide [Streptococcus]